MRLVRHRAAAGVAAGFLLVAKFALSQPGPGGGPPSPPASGSAPAASAPASATAPAEPVSATPPPVVSSAPVAPPRMTASAAPSASAAPRASAIASASAAPAASSSAKPEPPLYKPANHTLGIEVGVGLAARTSDFPTSSTQSERMGLGYHLGLQYGPTRMWSVGLQYSMTNAGVEKSPQGTEGLSESEIDRNLHSFLLELRMHPLPPENKQVVRFFVSLLAGVSFEHVTGKFTTATGLDGASGLNLITSTYSGNGGLGAALGAGLGLDVELGGGMGVIVRTSLLSHGVNDKTLSDDPLGRLHGGGTTTVFDARGGLQYRFDLGGGK